MSYQMTEIPKESVSDNCLLFTDVATLFNSASVQNENDAITVLLHFFMLESGFLPKGISHEDKYKLMPDAWNSNGVFRIKYEHSCCPCYTCCMTCVPLYETVSVHGIICDVGCSESISIAVNVSKYLNKSKDFSNNGNSRLYGILGLFDELKLYILQMLPVESVISLSAVNKEFLELANSPSLWKYLYIRDFSKGSVPDTDTTSPQADWKQMYVKEYLKTKKKFQPRRFIFPQSRLPEIFAVGPDYDMDIGINFDPPFPGPSLFNPPSLRPPFPPLFRRLF